MNIKQSLINRIVEREAVEIKKNLISRCDIVLEEVHTARKNNDAFMIRRQNDAELQEVYEYYIALKRKISVPIKEFILLDNEELGQEFEKYYNESRGKFIPVNTNLDF